MRVLLKIVTEFLDVIRQVHWFLQKVFRKSHVSDLELWSLDFTLAKVILPKLKAYKDMDRHGYPGQFIDTFKEGLKFGYSNEELQEALDKGKIIIGGFDLWNEYLDEMIFAFDYIVSEEGCSKIEKSFYKRWDIENPYVNESYNYELLTQYENRCQNGLELFGRFFKNLWD